ncbi:6-phospho-3-hexuloisomerase [Vagococcus acidifermentans]|uniref:6-phospho-3-hexuloisomerase n=1 Tax=Vagococcus acidifermentans TaxID=564710 RepID=A0A430ARK6_9ENTE|nr:6-phospho-3-hexuloisomerase [Vagococcus acidifermentans]RSU10693.1 6-phospho-3-hexuloisomerase [Vagococcus acidifermentans]
MSIQSNLISIIEELLQNTKQISNDDLLQLEEVIIDAKRIFIAGAGRSGFAARAFSNRLMHLGFVVYFVGEPTTPAIKEGDLLIISSGSGETASLVAMANKAKALNVTLGTLTIYPENSIGKLADVVVKVPGASSKTDESTSKSVSIQPNGSSFEQMSWLIYDSIVVELKKIKKQTQTDMDNRHANLE